VVSAKDTRTDTNVAVKKIKNCFENLTDAKRILREIKLLRHMEHPNIVALKDIIDPETSNDFEDVYLVLEGMQSDLHKVIHSDNQLSNKHIAYITYQMLCGVKYMHSANIIHRDLKPANILLNGDCRAKICDLGLARGDAEEDALLTEYVVTRWYRAPEVVVSARRYNQSVDVWAIGCILAEMYLKAPIFKGDDYVDQLRVIFKICGTPDESDLEDLESADVINFIRRLKSRERVDFRDMFSNASDEAIDLLEKLLVFNPRRRITVDEALRHPFFAEFYDEDFVNNSCVCDRQVDLEYEGNVDGKAELQREMLSEIRHFRPECIDVVEESPPRKVKLFGFF